MQVRFNIEESKRQETIYLGNSLEDLQNNIQLRYLDGKFYIDNDVASFNLLNQLEIQATEI